MLFREDRQHFVRYQKASEADSNPSTPTRMTAYVTEKSTARLPQRGDVIWVLARQTDAPPARCRFIYAFIVDEVPNAADAEKRFTGVRGLWLQESALVSDQPWFTAFFTKIGNGGISIQPIGDEWLQRLKELFDSRVDSVDGAAELEAEAEEQGWPEDQVRYGAIKSRRGQANFRANLIKAYGGRCCISACRVEALLEAAHIRPHALAPNYETRNGLLLRADIHTLFDLHLLAVDEYGRIHLSPKVPDLYYRELVSKCQRITYPATSIDRPSDDDLRARMAMFERAA